MNLRPTPRHDVTQTQLLRQLSALGCERFELGVKNEATQDFERRRDQSVDDLVTSIGWLKYKNTKGHHIYIRPEALEAVVLIDDVSASNLLQLDRDGIRCACVVETSDLNYQVWVRVSDATLSPDVATCLGELLASRYDADLASKDFRHFGRAVGFTNVKPEHQLESGYFPYAKIVEAQGGMTPNGTALLAEANALRDVKVCQRDDLRIQLARRPKSRPEEDVRSRYARAVQFVFDQYGSTTDPSRADASAALHLLFEGYAVSELEAAMLASADIQSRRPKSAEDYVRRTMDWARDRANTERGDER